MSGHFSEALGLTAEHLGLTAAAVAIAASVALPLGVALARRPLLAKAALGVANVAQTVPSLALFGFLIPLSISIGGVKLVGGIGTGTALAALVLYALLPILRNTVVGLQGVEPSVREAAEALGLTPWQRLWQVELPLALPIIVAGLRTAAVWTVGTATVAAAIDAGGLGRYIFRGLRAGDHELILWGALPAAMLAIALDAWLGALEAALAPGLAKGPRRLRGAVVALGAVSLLALGLAGRQSQALPAAGSAAAKAPLVLGGKDFTEQAILVELLAQGVEARGGGPVRRRPDLGGQLAHDALLAGELDAYVEYTGTALTAILHDPPIAEPQAALAHVRAAYAKRFRLSVGEPLGFANTFAILVRPEEAKAKGLSRISQLAEKPSAYKLGCGQDFASRPDGLPALAKAYGLRFQAVREMDLALTYRALAEGQIDVAAGNSTDGLIGRFGLVRLEDDRHHFPPYEAVPIVRAEALKQHPALAATLAALKGRLSEADMIRLNAAVDLEGQAPAEAAAAWWKGPSAPKP